MHVSMRSLLRMRRVEYRVLNIPLLVKYNLLHGQYEAYSYPMITCQLCVIIIIHKRVVSIVCYICTMDNEYLA